MIYGVKNGNCWRMYCGEEDATDSLKRIYSSPLDSHATINTESRDRLRSPN